MIVPMKKITVFVQSKDSDATISRLRSLGVLHVEHQRVPSGGNISGLQDEIALINDAQRVLAQQEYSQGLYKGIEEPTDWRFTAHHIIDMRKRLEQLEEYAAALKNRISQWQVWGDFEPSTIKNLNEKNIYVRFYQIPTKEVKNIPASVIIKKISVVGGLINCVAISSGKIDLPFKELSLPNTSLSKMRSRLAEDLKVMGIIKNEIKKHACYGGYLAKIRRLKELELEFHQVLRGMGGVGKIMYLTGYAPSDAVEALQANARREKWGIVVSEPTEDDKVPTLIRNPRWVSIIRPIFKVIEIIPGYRELDISMWFLIFFSIFFGMLISDAAYGLIFFILTFLAKKKWGRIIKENSVFTLFYILSTCAIIWGVLSGTFFGQAWLPQWVKPLIPELRDNESVQTICFLLGAIHLSIAHLWRGIVRLPSLRALSEAGWILILLAAFFLAKFLILGDNLPQFVKWLLICGAGLVLFFTNPRKNIFKGLGQGLGNLLLNLVNNFTDIVSYIRLFAVGLATVAVADSFNKMAMEIGFGSVASTILTALILLVGHALNILLGPMSILVHGVRLNVLEFCNHLDVKWSGFAYKPLKEEVIS